MSGDTKENDGSSGGGESGVLNGAWRVDEFV